MIEQVICIISRDFYELHSLLSDPTDCYYKPDDIITNIGNVDTNVTTVYIHWLQFAWLLYASWVFLIKKPIILPICSSKIGWDNYAPLQLISQYFPASGRSLQAKFFRGIRTCQKGAAILDLKVARPWERVLWPIMQCCETRGWFQRSNDYRSVEDFEMWGNEV